MPSGTNSGRRRGTGTANFPNISDGCRIRWRKTQNAENKKHEYVNEALAAMAFEVFGNGTCSGTLSVKRAANASSRTRQAVPATAPRFGMPSIICVPGIRSLSGDWIGLGRSLKDLIARADVLRSQGVGLRSLKEAIDTDSSAGQLIFHIFGALAEFERALIRERTQAGLKAARARGRVGGRRKKLDTKKRAHVVELYRSGKHTVKEICTLMGVSRATVYSYVNAPKA